MKVEIKPLTVNQAWKGRRFRTDKYKKYTKDVMIQLKDMAVPPGDLELYIQAGLSNRNADIDNIAKPFIDILQKRYGFNDNRIFHLVLMKRIVPKGQEFISFELMSYLEK